MLQNYLVTSKYATKEGHEATHHTHTHIQTSREEIGRRSMTGENLRLSGHAPSTTKRGAQNMADSRSRRQELVEPEAYVKIEAN